MDNLNSEPRAVRVAVIGDRRVGLVPQDSIETALSHSAAALGVTIDVTWFVTPALEHDAANLLADADAVWCAPGGPFASLEGAVDGIRFAREHGRPFLGTCAGFQLGVIEFARNVLGIADAKHAEYDDDRTSPLFIDELLCSLVGQAMTVRLVDPVVRAAYGADEAIEEYYCRFGLDESYTPALSEAGLMVAGVDAADGTTRIVRVGDHPFFAMTLFVPQARSTRSEPHPIVTEYLATAARVGDHRRS